jgi:4-methyl-5(b-hydroxyethyl)-thiazole monophosphate biosynthesis
MRRLLLLIPRGAEILETAAFFDVFGWANAEGRQPIEVVTVGVEPTVRSAFGFRVLPDAVLDQISAQDFDALAIPGGFEEHGYYEQTYADEVAALIRSFDEAGKPIASVCVGALPIAASGALRDRRATTYHLGRGRRRAQLADLGVEVVDSSIVRDRNILTSTSPATAIDVAFMLLAELTDDDNARLVRSLMGYPPD